MLFTALVATASLATSGGVAAAFRSAVNYAAQRVERKCEAALAAGEQQLAEAHSGSGAGAEGAAHAAESHFRAALTSLEGFGSSRLAPAVRSKLESRAHDGCARSLLRLARPEGATADARRAVDAARRAGDDTLRRSACGTLSDALLQCARSAAWNMAQQYARDALASACEADDAHRRSLATATLAAAYRGDFEARMACVENLLQRRSWAHAVTEAGTAAAVARNIDDAAMTRAAAALAAARAGACDAHLAASAAAAQLRRWPAALAEADAASRMHSFGDAARAALAATALAAARVGMYDMQMALAAQAEQGRRWTEALSQAQRALANAVGNQQRAARAAIARAHAALAEEARREAERRATAEAARRAAEAAHRAAMAAGPGCVTAVDDCIRRQPTFMGHAPRSFRCPIAAVVSACPTLSAVPGALLAFLRLHTEAFAVDTAGAVVSVTQLTPFRGHQDQCMYGEFRCVKCGGRWWTSGSTYCDEWQKCQRCETETYPFAQRPLERQRAEDGRDNGRPHDSGRCGRCRRGQRCAAAARTFAGGGGRY
jgi:hypothetical protein